MKAIYHLLLPSLVFSTTLSTAVYAQEPDNGLDNLSTYLINLGAFLGYDLTTKPDNSKPVSPLTDITTTQNVEQSAFSTGLGAIPVNSISNALMYFVPSADSILNTLTNATFTTPPYNTSTQDGNVTVNPLIDQLPYQADPVSQAIQNILETPNYSVCMDNPGVQWTGGTSGGGITSAVNAYPSCTYLYGTGITSNVVRDTTVSDGGNTPPSADKFFGSTYTQQFLGQLNSNALIAPLLYSVTASGTASKSNALPAQSQAQEAANFVRYASGAVMPLSLPSRNVYDKIYMTATSGTNDLTQITAQATLSNYLAGLRVYAAQSSVGFSNLYYMLSRRMPQNIVSPGGSGGSSPPPQSSQALSEFKMATWRLQNPDQSPNTQWLNQINQASTATIEKEMVTLLAEINYQLYLTRQQEERMLLTNTMLLFLNSHSVQPDADKLAQVSSGASSQ